jgi:hypothetical protein
MLVGQDAGLSSDGDGCSTRELTWGMLVQAPMTMAEPCDTKIVPRSCVDHLWPATS